MARTVQGNAFTWQISDNPIGSGDAGEVYSVTCLEQPNLTGVMKRPAKVATAGTIQRQAGQIAQEALALNRLDGLPDGKAHPPRLLDQAPEFTQGTANYFLISETAPGEDMDTLLAGTRQTGKPFPRRVIITVLDALFDMFSRAHKAGVLWNDVKLEHIYWYNPTGQISVIDWGNALFLDGKGQRSLPRWQDYQQMVDVLGNFLKRSAPELYVDLGWDEFQGQALDSPRVSILARRISYQQQVVALQVMEYQALIRVLLGEDPSLEGLRKIAGYQAQLEIIGAPWDKPAVLDYSQSLIESALAEGDIQTSVGTTALVWDSFDESLDLPWYLLREYCRHTDILSHSEFPTLVKHTLRTQWEGAIWAASMIANHSQSPIWWEALIPVMRQAALGTATPPPYQTCRSLLQWARETQPGDLTHQLDAILKNWRVTGTDLKESPLDYALLDLIHEKNAHLPNRLRSEVKQSFAQGEEAVRELMNVWNNATWEALPKAFRKVLSWDPDRWGILQLAEQVDKFQTWLTDLYEGPAFGSNVRHFFTNALDERPKVERMLGSPSWMTGLLNMLEMVSQGELILSYQTAVERFCPWLLQYPDLNAFDAFRKIPDENALQIQLSHFAGHLKNWSNIDAGLTEILEQTPGVYHLSNQLAEGFKSILSLNSKLERIEMICSEPVPHPLSGACDVLQSLLDWRKQLAAKDLEKAIQVLNEDQIDGWVLAAHARQITLDWGRIILPNLKAISSFSFTERKGQQLNDPNHKLLSDIAAMSADLFRLWGEIDNSGIHTHLLATFEEKIETARTTFLNWRVAMENTTDLVERLLYHTHLNEIRQLSSRFSRMAQHIRQAKLAFTMLIDGSQTSLTIQMKSMDQILDYLAALEAEFVPDPHHRHFPNFQSAFREIMVAKTAQTRQELAFDLPENHPFFAWLVKSTLA